jgi:hypothetical protein
VKTSDRTVHRIGDLVQQCEGNERSIGVRSTGEAIAIALVLNRPDLLPDGYTHVLHAVDRLGDDWLKAAIEVARCR